jgi:putative Mg2+ transporter-C (MgtC) family protein
VCGILIGIERERKEKPTGTRTLSLVCVGAAVFTGYSSSDAHVAAQIVTGVGFLGAGAIIHSRFGVLGLTSAATIWSVAAIGMTFGRGYAGGGLALTLLVLLMLTVISNLERGWIGRCKMADTRVVYLPAGGKTLVKLEGLLDEVPSPGLAIKDHGPGPDDASEQIVLHHCTSHQHHREILSRVAEVTEVLAMIRPVREIHAGHKDQAEHLQTKDAARG